MVRGWVTNCVALVLALWAAPAFAQTPPGPGEPFPPIFGNGAPAGPAPGARTAFQQPPPSVELGTPTSPDVTLPPGTAVTPPPAKPRELRFAPRYATPITFDTQLLADGIRRTVFTGGVIINLTGDAPEDTIEVAADDMVVWSRGLEMDKRLQPEGAPPPPPESKNQLELYLAGNVIIRSRPRNLPANVPPALQIQTIRGKEIYYDVDRERAVALGGQFEFTPVLITPSGPIPAPDPVHFNAAELDKLDAENYQGKDASLNASKTPSDPGLRFDTPKMYMTDRLTQLRNVFGLPYRDLLTGEPVIGQEKIITAWDMVPHVEGVPVFWFPYYRANADEPLGPLMNLGGAEDHILGAQVRTTWNLFELFALKPPQGQRWTLNLDYLSLRGVGIGSDYNYHLPPSDPASGLMGADGLIHYYGINDHGLDDLGPDRGVEPQQPSYRQWFDWHHQQELTSDLYFQGQLAYVSDKNFIEQYYKQLWDTGPNQETFADLTWQQQNYYLTGLVEQNFDRPWIPETSWLPRIDGALIGQSLFDRLVYTAKADAGYAMMHPTDTNPVSLQPTDQRVDTGRIDLYQELSAPFGLGPFQLDPYALLDLTGYSQDLAGNPIGRVWGGGGLRASLSASHLYEDVTSDLFNVRDLYHKMVLSANYLYAQTNVHYYQLPMLNRLNDDATDQSWRDVKPMESFLYGPVTGSILQSSPLFDPQQYAIRRALLNQIDTLDDMDVLQLDLRQRLQTKRGFPGDEHEVDWMTLDASVSYFPETSYNVGHPWSFAEWNYLWNVGDRVALTSTGWIEPYSGGTRYWTVSGYLNRPDRTNFMLSYRQTDPLNSKELLASVSYQLSKRYYVTGSTSYDFGLNQSASNTLSLTRTGSDLTVTVGITYNSLVNNFGLMLMVMPNAFASLIPGGGPVGMPGQH